MDYQQEAYLYSMGGRQNVLFQQQLQHPMYAPQDIGLYHPTAAMHGYSDISAQSYYGYDDLDSNGPAPRPRLTKEQVDVLESQFQSHNKPSGQTKRTLAVQTGLHINRVANWFQNRRAKAKQQRKQQEFEDSLKEDARNKKTNLDEDEDDEEDADEPEEDEHTPENKASKPQVPIQSQSAPRASPVNAQADSRPAEARKDAAYQSLERARASAMNELRRRNTESQALTGLSMAPPPWPSQLTNSQDTHQRPSVSDHAFSTLDSWIPSDVLTTTWDSSPPVSQSMFNFDFDQVSRQVHQSNSDLLSPTDSSQQSFLSPNSQGWEDNMLTTPTAPIHGHAEYTHPLPSPSLNMPSYNGSRRPSAAELLANNLNEIDLQTPASGMDSEQAHLMLSQQHANIVDLAGRRKRPRPAALTSSALRSRSHGTLSSTSPTFRPGMAPTPVHGLRHVKSTGHSLSNHYAGIRKSSVAQRSPLTASFSETEALQKLLQRKAAEANASHQQLTPINTQQSAMQNGLAHAMNGQSAHSELGNYVQEAQMPHLSSFQSPPITPFQQDLVMQHGNVPSSIGPQYAVFKDYTPPYSAGPLTNSSWSDAALTSPDLAAYTPTVSTNPLAFTTQDDRLTPVTNYLSPEFSDIPAPLGDSKQTEFYIQVFSGQKEAHAHVASQLNSQKPKSYTFNNSQPADYREL